MASLHKWDLLKGFLMPLALIEVMWIDIVSRVGGARWMQKRGVGILPLSQYACRGC